LSKTILVFEHAQKSKGFLTYYERALNCPIIYVSEYNLTIFIKVVNLKYSGMVFEIIAYSICLIALVTGSITDIKTREVPDWLNYSLIAAGFALALIKSIAYWDYLFFVYSLLGFLAFFIIAMAMFYSGQWGGGDSKMIMGLGALIGLNFSFGSFLIAFFVNMLLAGALYGLLWSLILVFKHKKKFINEIRKILALRQLIMAKNILLAFLLISIILSFFIKSKIMQMQLVALPVISLVTLYLWASVKSVENACMFKYVKPAQLTEGDWIAKDIIVGGKKICGPKDLGIEKKQIRLLIKLHHQNKVKNVLIKEGIPFVPSFLIAFVITLIFGNLFFNFLLP